MRRLVPLILVLVVMLTGVGLGAARGAVPSGRTVVLCTGHGVVVTVLPDDRGRVAHLCPDMALSLLAAVAPADVLLPQRNSVLRHLAPALRLGAPPAAGSAPRARDPPNIPRA